LRPGRNAHLIRGVGVIEVGKGRPAGRVRVGSHRKIGSCVAGRVYA
jgi:hypothetical protein